MQPDRVMLRLTPFVRIVIPFMAGIVTALYLQLAWSLIISGVVMLFLLFLMMHRNRKLNRSYSKRWLYGLLLYLLIAFLGHAYMRLYASNPLQERPEGKQIYQAYLIDQPQTTENSIKTIVRLQARRDSLGQWQKQQGKILVYMQQDSNARALQYGDQIVLRAAFDPISNPGNPYAFDYKQYMARRNIHFQTWLNDKSWKKLDTGLGNPIMLAANKLRTNLLDFYRHHEITGRNFEVAAALTLGFKDYLRDETRQMYASSGAMHILAVSGLHMGIIFLIFQRLFGLLPFPGRLNFLKPLFIILALWGFAILTGLSPSVMRASVMFSFVVIGKNMKRPTNIYNTLAASAFVLLLFNPFLITYAGFQLSYTAVIAIVFFQPKIYSLLYVPNKWLDKAWALIAVSVAAQIGTAPLGLFYFHQFPNYFILTNIAVIPLATGILYTAVAAFAFSFLPVVDVVLTFLLKMLLTALNASVHFIQSLPGSVSLDVPFHASDLFLVYLAVVLLALYTTGGKARSLQLMLGVLILFFGIRIARSVSDFQRPELYVYNTRDGLLLNIMQGNTSTLLADSTAYSDTRLREFAANAHLVNEHVHTQKLVPLQMPRSKAGSQQMDARIATPDFQVVLLNKTTNIPDSLNFKPDLLILNGYPADKLASQISKLNPRVCLLPASTSWYYRKKIRNLQKDWDFPLHNTAKDGAFRLTPANP